MGLEDRPYMHPGHERQSAPPGGMRGMTLGMPKPGNAVKWLLILNGVVFLLQIFFDRGRIGRVGAMSQWLGVTADEAWQIWRFVTFQFLHSVRSPFHIIMNMLGLYFLGTALEQRYGAKRFVAFYLSCGVTAGLTYVIANIALGMEGWIPLIGASGGVFGIILAAAILFPHFRIIFLFFPVPIRFAAMIIFGIMGFVILSGLADEGMRGGSFWSQVAHLGGVIAAAGWLWFLPRAQQAAAETRQKINQGAWERKIRRQAENQREIDDILAKIHNEGIGSLTPSERKKLQDATRRQRDEEQRIRRL